MDVLTVLLPVTAVAATLVAGIFGAFSVAVMPALHRGPAAVGTSVMQRVNRVILNPFFLVPFLGTAAACVVLIVAAWSRPLVVAGALTYLIGSLGLTAAVHVPLNVALDRIGPDPTGRGIEPQWRHFAARWTPWNHVRTLACLVAAALLLAGR